MRFRVAIIFVVTFLLSADNGKRVAVFTSAQSAELGKALEGPALESYESVARLNVNARERPPIVQRLVTELRAENRNALLSALERWIYDGAILTRLGCVEVLSRDGSLESAGILLSVLPVMDDLIVRTRIVRSLPSFLLADDHQARSAYLEIIENPGTFITPELMVIFASIRPFREDRVFNAEMDLLMTRIATALARETDPVRHSLSALAEPRLRTGARKTLLALLPSTRFGILPEQWESRWEREGSYQVISAPNEVALLREQAFQTIGESGLEASSETLSALSVGVIDAHDNIREATWRAVERLIILARDEILSDTIAEDTNLAQSVENMPITSDDLLFHRPSPPSNLELPLTDDDLNSEEMTRLQTLRERYGRSASSAAPSSQRGNFAEVATSTFVGNALSLEHSDSVQYFERHRERAEAFFQWAKPLSQKALDDSYPSVSALAAICLTRLSITDAEKRAALHAIGRVLGKPGTSLLLRSEALRACSLLPLPESADLLNAALEASPSALGETGSPEGFALVSACLDGLFSLSQSKTLAGTAALSFLQKAAESEQRVAGDPEGRTLGEMAKEKLR